MKTIALAGSGERVSEFALGTMYFGSRMDDRQSADILEKYLDLGGSFIDTANNYAHWVPGCEGTESESFLGRWFEKTGRRSEVFLATKVGFDRHGQGRGLRRGQIVENCEKSLQLLKTDRIDLYYAHTDDRNTPLEESLEAFDLLFRQGKIRHLGASNYVSWRYVDALGVSEDRGLVSFCCLQNQFSYLCRSPADFDPHHVAIDPTFLDLSAAHRFPLVAYSPLLRGFYADPAQPLPKEYDNWYNRKRLAALMKVKEEIGDVTPGRLVLAWMRAQKADIIPIISGSTVEQIADNLAAGNIGLTAGQVELLNRPEALMK
jgi:aryl-alcohol dehydrogenase-like predicted oxidoreductase